MMTAISETRPGFNQRLVSRRNGQATLTDKGMLAHELVPKFREDTAMIDHKKIGTHGPLTTEMIDMAFDNMKGEDLTPKDEFFHRIMRIVADAWKSTQEAHHGTVAVVSLAKCIAEELWPVEAQRLRQNIIHELEHKMLRKLMEKNDV